MPRVLNAGGAVRGRLRAWFVSFLPEGLGRAQGVANVWIFTFREKHAPLPHGAPEHGALPPGSALPARRQRRGRVLRR